MIKTKRRSVMELNGVSYISPRRADASVLNEVGVSCPAEPPIVGGAVEASLEAAVETQHSYEYVASTLR